MCDPNIRGDIPETATDSVELPLCVKTNVNSGNREVEQLETSREVFEYSTEIVLCDPNIREDITETATECVKLSLCVQRNVNSDAGGRKRLVEYSDSSMSHDM